MPWNPYAGRMELPNMPNYGYYQPYAQQITSQVLRVNGIEGAKALQMGPNASAFAADETDPNRIFLCVTDGAGFKTIRPIRGTFEDVEQPKPNVTEERISEFEKRLNTLEAKVDERINSAGPEQPRRRSADYSVQ